MKFTCLSKGGGFHFPPCHILEISGFRILFDVPLDLSALTIFSPIPIGFEEPLCSPESDIPIRQEIETPFSAKDLIYSEPWYKTVESLHLWKESSIDVLLISSPMGMLGLPFLTRMKGFSAKICATEATARIGQLMLEDLVTMHMEFRQFYGAEESNFPQWMRWQDVAHLPSALKEIVSGKDGGKLGGWMPLYSAVDVKNCMQKVHTLKYLEETCYNDDRENEDHDPSTNDSASLRSLTDIDDNSEESEKLSFVCACAVDAVKTGGSVLIPMYRIGILLQLLEQISASLDSSNLKVPIYFISSVAEELLALTNIIPEWLCRERQEKLFSGEPLFSHVELVKEEKVHVFAAVHSPELLTNWQEPCIVFSPSGSLRLGPVVHLLRHWCGDQNSLLVLENGIDAELALLPFKPMAMKVLQCSFLSGIKLREVQPLLEVLQPKVVALPEDLKKICFPTSMLFSVLRYTENETLIISSLKSSEVEIPMDLATQFNFKKLKQEHISVTRLKGDLTIGHGKHHLLSGNKPTDLKCRHIMHWGSPDIERLFAALSKMGIKGTVGGGTMDAESENFSQVQITEPSRACIEIRATSTVIITIDENLASRISDAICSVLAGI
ncbi:integrator complex subunit 9 homolog isoform X2 [Morus notabilis]|uniref:integrator complex subunit 9 homolog isoform X2 n=1 Tax=Morus notabilis TaxID=981085 RepID=UPI000CED0914|nr:integrator complex subunit 9 homolog isoform X2 [Morus notabilis]